MRVGEVVIIPLADVSPACLIDRKIAQSAQSCIVARWFDESQARIVETCDGLPQFRAGAVIDDDEFAIGVGLRQKRRECVLAHVKAIAVTMRQEMNGGVSLVRGLSPTAPARFSSGKLSGRGGRSSSSLSRHQLPSQ